MNTNLFHAFIGGLLVLASAVCTSSVYAGPPRADRDQVVFDDAFGIFPSWLNGSPYDFKISLPDGIVSTKRDGSVIVSDLKDQAKGSIYMIVIVDGADAAVLAELPIKHVCLSVESNTETNALTVYIWNQFTETVPGVCVEGQFALNKFVLNEDGSGAVFPVEIPLTVTSIPGCGSATDEQYIHFPPGFPGLPLFGVTARDGIE